MYLGVFCGSFMCSTDRTDRPPSLICVQNLKSVSIRNPNTAKRIRTCQFAPREIYDLSTQTADCCVHSLCAN